METSITLDCGCEIEFQPPHDARCNCAEAMGTCQTGTWFMQEPCDDHKKPEKVMTTKWKLCYVSGAWAYFTTQDLKDQWGDDWNDAPYEHNAGTPYTPSWKDKEEGKSWEIAKLAWEGKFDEPCTDLSNSPWSVQDVNNGACPWLRTNKYKKGESIFIHAGISQEEFTKLIQNGGGKVYGPEAGCIPPMGPPGPEEGSKDGPKT